MTNNNWISPTYGHLILEEIPQYIREYYNKMKQYDTNIQITIGTDSQNFNYTKEVNVIAVICEGQRHILL